MGSEFQGDGVLPVPVRLLGGEEYVITNDRRLGGDPGIKTTHMKVHSLPVLHGSIGCWTEFNGGRVFVGRRAPHEEECGEDLGEQ